MYTPTPLEEAVYTFVDNVCKDTVIIYANQGSPRPPQTFGTLMLLDDVGLQLKNTFKHMDVEEDAPEFRMIMETEREARFSIQFFGPTAYQRAYEFIHDADTSDNIVAAHFLGFATRQFSSVERVSMTTSTGIESRAMLTMRIGYRLSKMYTYDALRTFLATPEF